MSRPVESQFQAFATSYRARAHAEAALLDQATNDGVERARLAAHVAMSRREEAFCVRALVHEAHTLSSFAARLCQALAMRADLAGARREGGFARRHGCDENANPFSGRNDALRAEWHRGWREG